MMKTNVRQTQAVVRYNPSDFTILKPGSYVVCAVTGRHIPISELRYWNPELQEAYADAHAATARWRELNEGGAS
ncbi:MAG: DUF2093 domain-containing protein [Caulobacterales bacterium]|nr:DUF2093 domain-containing protein [Caulobacterales bacterium]